MTLYRKEYNNSTWNWTYIHNIVKIKYISIIYFYLYSHSIKNWWLNNNLQKEKLTFFLSKLSQTTIKRTPPRCNNNLQKEKPSFLSKLPRIIVKRIPPRYNNNLEKKKSLSPLFKPFQIIANHVELNDKSQRSTIYKKKPILSPLQIEPLSISNFQPSQTL